MVLFAGGHAYSVASEGITRVSTSPCPAVALLVWDIGKDILRTHLFLDSRHRPSGDCDSM